MADKRLVIDANIIVRAVLGKRVRELITKHYKVVNFFTPDVCMIDAQKYLPEIFKKRQLPFESVINLLHEIAQLVEIVPLDIYEEYQKESEQRMRNRDVEDWPIVATALTLDSPIWTEDQDFFGSGLPTWTTDNIELFFKN